MDEIQFRVIKKHNIGIGIFILICQVQNNLLLL